MTMPLPPPTFGQRTLGTTLMTGWTMAALFLAGRLPLLGALLLALAGLPAMVVGLAWGAAWFALYTALTLGLTSWLGGGGFALLLVPMLLLPAALLAGLAKAGLAPLRAIAATLLLATLFSVAVWGVLPLIDEGGSRLWAVKELFLAQKQEFARKIQEFQQQGEGDPQSLQVLLEHFQAWMDFILLLVPVTFIFTWHLLSLAVFYLGALALGARFGFTLTPLPPFATWRFDWNLIWLFIVGWFLFHGADLVGPASAQTLFRQVGANCLAISKLLYFIAGLSIVYFWFDSYKISAPNRIGLSCLALLLTNLLVWLGIIDVWADFRAPRSPATPSTRARDDDEEDSFFD
ncbi:MAG: hypothetical protein OZSIB_0219 [Candidatus Ozemobacter sibiricus]|uniref:DUF2232 domain-containing protein n=1 Tax=Candidatus Ozemobacter sibiricus TaxID=2268124 RepID=A0A367ZMJ6_9BACT|nr:MAG: hypothetical protein OZSIB_0219 [Candidatus Ozemobacter sibiricus]